MADPAALDPQIRAVLGRPFAEQVAFFRGKLGNLVPTSTWTDLLRSAHDRAFMVAGAQRADLLAGLAAAVDRAIAEGRTIADFRKDFEALVQRTGWSYTGEFNWRTRVIYTTNIATSYAAGRLAQLRAGGFGWWIYKHSDSVQHPRPLHVSWNGLVLPANDPWWSTHYPPNGWGCRCRVIGVRRAEDAARYGAVRTVAPNDGIDSRTGEPAGIDKGWGYQPGDTVSDTVAQMAAKTQQWDYTLAKAYMQGVPEAARDQLSVAYRGLPSVADDVRRYAQQAIEGASAEEMAPYRTLGLVAADQVNAIRDQVVLDVAGYDYALDRSGIQHVRATHGSAATEAPRGQREVTAADYSRIPAALNAPDEVVDVGVSRQTRQRLIKISGDIDGERYVTVWEIRPGRRSLALQSFWVGKADRGKP